MPNVIDFKIIISQDYKIKCCYVDSQNNETPIKLNNSEQEYYPIIISFDNNFKYTVSQENEKSIQFMEDLFTNPEEYKVYNIQFQNKEYSVISEVLFALIINDFKQQIEKEYIIEKTLIQIPLENKLLIERIQISLEAIGCKGLSVSDNEITFDYSEQGEILQEILEKKEEYSKRERMIERANQIAQEENMEKINVSSDSLFTSQQFREQMFKFSIQEREKMKLYKLDNYCIFIASRYLDSIDDHINLVKVCKRLRCNLEKFHYNPVSVDEETIKFFPNIETLHKYEKKDEYLTGGRIIQYVDWVKTSWNKMEEIRKENEGKLIEFKNVVFTEEDVEEVIEDDEKIEIPEGVKEIDENAFYGYDVVEIHIPQTVKIIPTKCLQFCDRLTNITIPLNETRIVCGNKIFNYHQILK